jgi:hypothetical protein
MIRTYGMILVVQPHCPEISVIHGRDWREELFDGDDSIGHFGFFIPWASHFPDFNLDDIGWRFGHGKSDVLVKVDWFSPERGNGRSYFLEGDESD